MLKGLFSFFENLIPPFVEAEGRKLPENLMGFVAFFSRGLYRFFFAVALLNTLIAAGEALFFLSLGYIVDWTASTSPSLFLSAHGSSLLIMLLVAGVILPVSSVLHSLLIHQTISSNYSMLVRFQLHSILLGKSMSFFSEEYSGALANKVMQTSLAVRTAVMKLLDVSVHLIVYIATMLIMLSSSSFTLCLPLVVWLVVYIVSLIVFIPRLSQCSKDVSVRRSKMVGRIVDSYTNILTVKVFGGHGKEADFTREAMDEYRKGEYGSLRILTLFDISVQMMNYTMLIVLVMISLWLWSNYLTTPGVIAIAIAVAIRLINMSRWIMWEAGVVFENLGMIYDGMKTISRPSLLCDPKNPKDLHGFGDEIEFKDVTFAYKGKKAVFEGLNLKIKKGEKIGIAGSSGAGKSTLVSLL
ncbi:MAG: ABC transporter transmembrane domain-containing protein, partial [Succinivibrio sp.]